MAKQLSKAGIAEGSIVEAHHVTQSIDAFTGEVPYDITLEGSYTLTGSMYTTDTVFSKNFQASSALTVKGDGEPLIFLDKDNSNYIRFRNSTGNTNRGYIGFIGSNLIINQQSTGNLSLYNNNIESLRVDTSNNITIPNGGLTVKNSGVSSQIELHKDDSSRIEWRDAGDSSTRGYIGYAVAGVDSFVLYNGEAKPMKIYNNGSKTLEIDTSQNVTFEGTLNGDGSGLTNVSSTGGTGTYNGTFIGNGSGLTNVTSTGGTGTYNGTFIGNGSGLTGVTSEWDGTRVGDSSITGQLTIIDDDDRPLQIRDSNSTTDSTSYISFRNSTDTEQAVIGIDSTGKLRVQRAFQGLIIDSTRVDSTKPLYVTGSIQSSQGLTVSSQGLTVSSGGANITGTTKVNGSSTITGSLDIFTNASRKITLKDNGNNTTYMDLKDSSDVIRGTIGVDSTDGMRFVVSGFRGVTVKSAGETHLSHGLTVTGSAFMSGNADVDGTLLLAKASGNVINISRTTANNSINSEGGAELGGGSITLNTNGDISASGSIRSEDEGDGVELGSNITFKDGSTSVGHINVNRTTKNMTIADQNYDTKLTFKGNGSSQSYIHVENGLFRVGGTGASTGSFVIAASTTSPHFNTMLVGGDAGSIKDIVTDSWEQSNNISYSLIVETGGGGQGHARFEGLTIVSDQRKKEVLHNHQNVIENFHHLNPVMYRDLGDGTIRSGFIAQEIEKVIPEVVHITSNGEYDDWRAVDYNQIIPYNTAAIKDLIIENNLLKDKNKELEDRLKLIEEKLGL